MALGVIASCAHPLPKPPVAPRAATFSRSYLSDKAVGIIGDQQGVRDGIFCAGDGAFSLPVVPFPEGPTELSGPYYNGGVTSSIEMINPKESVLMVVRTKIRPDLPADQVLPRVADKQEHAREVAPGMTVEWIKQNGRTQFEVVCPSVNYSGREDIMYLSVSQGWNNQKDGCRVDRHFVAAGYYFQIIAVIHQPERPGAPKPERDSCDMARELAAWTSENIRTGVKCGG